MAARNIKSVHLNFQPDDALKADFQKALSYGGKQTEGCEATDDFLGFGDGDFQEENLLG